MSVAKNNSKRASMKEKQSASEQLDDQLRNAIKSTIADVTTKVEELKNEIGHID